MADLGIYKTTYSKTFHLHFNREKQVAFAFGPLPDLTINHEVKAKDEKEAIEKLKQDIGPGVFANPMHK
jgi:hypothetical protein